MSLSLADLGLDPDDAPSLATDDGALPADDADETVETPVEPLPPLVTGSALARALYSVWTGQPVTVISSPPGGGKTTVLVALITHLATRSDLSIGVGCPTKRGAADVIERLNESFERHAHKQGRPLAYGNDVDLQTSVARSAKSRVRVSTIHSLMAHQKGFDLLIVDEAFQATYGNVFAAADKATQVLMVGDPGQIGPVVTVDTSAYLGPYAPHLRAPDVFARRDDAIRLHLPETYRVGADTVKVIAPLYDFDFVSRRPDRTLVTPTGEARPEIERVVVDESTGAYDIDFYRSVARIAASRVGSTVVTPESLRGEADPITLEQGDVAVVVARNAQVAGITACLAQAGFDKVTVGTADSMQGGQWHAVIAVDPLIGGGDASDFRISPGRLCVMLSRHMTSLTWVCDEACEASLAESAKSSPAARVGLDVRRRLASVAGAGAW